LTIGIGIALKFSTLAASDPLIDFNLPETGGQGLKILVISGILIILVGFLLKMHRPYKPKRADKNPPSDTESKY
jgi:LPXTG-motif cell wall-anchored protein